MERATSSESIGFNAEKTLHERAGTAANGIGNICALIAKGFIGGACKTEIGG